MATTGYATELQSLKHEISQLTTLITTTVEQIKQALASLPMTSPQPESNAMEMDNEMNLSPKPQMAINQFPLHQIDLQVIIQELKTDIATITNKMCAMLQQHLPPPLTITNKSSSKT